MDSAVFLGVFPYRRRYQDFLNLDDRVRTSISSVSINRFVYMVGCRSADRKSGRYLETPLVLYDCSLFYRLLGHYSDTSLVSSLLEPVSVYHLKIGDGVISSLRWGVL